MYATFVFSINIYLKLNFCIQLNEVVRAENIEFNILLLETYIVFNFFSVFFLVAILCCYSSLPFYIICICVYTKKRLHLSTTSTRRKSCVIIFI